MASGINQYIEDAFTNDNGYSDGDDNDEEVVEAALRGISATVAGFVVNFFLMQFITTQHILKISLTDLVRGNVTWLEYLSAFIQIVMVAAVAAMVAMTPADLLTGLRNQDCFGWFQALLIFGIFGPAAVLLFLFEYFGWTLARDAELAASNFIQKRHNRLSKMEFRFVKAE